MIPTPGHSAALKVALLALGLLLAGCGDSRTEEETHEDAGLLEPQRQALEKARGVEDDLAETARRQQQEIDDQGG
jgi:hypothetical protein